MRAVFRFGTSAWSVSTLDPGQSYRFKLDLYSGGRIVGAEKYWASQTSPEVAILQEADDSSPLEPREFLVVPIGTEVPADGPVERFEYLASLDDVGYLHIFAVVRSA